MTFKRSLTLPAESNPMLHEDQAFHASQRKDKKSSSRSSEDAWFEKATLENWRGRPKNTSGSCRIREKCLNLALPSSHLHLRIHSLKLILAWTQTVSTTLKKPSQGITWVGMSQPTPLLKTTIRDQILCDVGLWEYVSEAGNYIFCSSHDSAWREPQRHSRFEEHHPLIWKKSRGASFGNQKADADTSRFACAPFQPESPPGCQWISQ